MFLDTLLMSCSKLRRLDARVSLVVANHKDVERMIISLCVACPRLFTLNVGSNDPEESDFVRELASRYPLEGVALPTLQF